MKIINKVVNLLNKKYELFGVFVIGSQNYNLDLEDSDYDTVALVLPTIGNLYYGDKYIENKVVQYEEGLCKVTDIRDFYKGLLKSNLNYIELLYSKEYYINENYKIDYEYLRENREIASSINVKNLLNCAIGMMNVNHKKKADWLSKNGNSHYSTYHILRMCNFIYSFIKGCPLEACFISEVVFTNEEIKQFKKGGISASSFTSAAIEKIVYIIKDMANNYLLEDTGIDNASAEHLREVFNIILNKYFDF